MDKLTDEELAKSLTDTLDECLEGINADGSIIGCKIDRENKKVFFEFDIIEVPEDNYIGFAGY